ncbi:MAG: arginine--tRNA ligase [Planctomycetes bacterium]|nr:arginine--tRNA ligase [Planctomycetota bacterium]
MSLHQEIRRRVEAAVVAALGPEHAQGESLLQPSRDPRFGDFQCNAALPAAKALGSKPRDLALKIVEKLDLAGLCAAPEIAGPGFVNLRIEDRALASALMATHGDPRCGVAPRSAPQRVVVDYSSPNLAKDLHVGTFRTTVIGDSIARTLEFLGHTVLRQNHYGDWGTNFGTLVAVLKREFGPDLAALERLDLPQIEALYTQGSSLRKDDPAFARDAAEEALKLQQGEPSSRAAWRRLMDVTLANCAEIYQRLDVTMKPEHDRPESSYNADLSVVLDDLQRLGLLTTSEGAKVVFVDGFVNREGEPLPAIVQKADGGYNYTTTDLAAMRHRVRNLRADRIVIVTDRGQSLHFEMMAAVARKAGWLPESTVFTHVGYGVIQREIEEDGKKKKVRFKTRAGGTVKIRELLAEGVERCEKIALEKNAELAPSERTEIALRLTVAGLKYTDLKQRPDTDYVFDWDQMLAVQGDTGVYLLYAYVRIRSVFEKAGADAASKVLLGELRFTHPAERELALHLAKCEDVFSEYERELAATPLCRYAYDLATLFNRFYHDCPILKAEEEGVRAARLELSYLAAERLRLVLGLLGIRTVERM